MNPYGNKKHGHHGTLTYKRWKSMRQRCAKTNTGKAKYYSEKGIGITDRWAKFENFLADMGECPDVTMTLERMDNAMGYGPDNCRWATQSEQNKNRSHCIELTLNGETLILSEWAKRLNISPNLLRQRIFKLGWSVEKALTTEKKARIDA